MLKSSIRGIVALCVVLLVAMCLCAPSVHFFFFNDTATTEIYTLSLHDALPIYVDSGLDSFRGSIPPERIGVNLGVGLGGLPEIVAMHETWRQGGFRKISPFFILQTAPN